MCSTITTSSRRTTTGSVARFGPADQLGDDALIAEGVDQLLERGPGFQAVGEVGEQFIGDLDPLHAPQASLVDDLANQRLGGLGKIGGVDAAFHVEPTAQTPPQQVAPGRVVEFPQ